MKHDFIDKYSNLNSVVHKIDPRIKLLLLFCFLIFIAVTSNLKLMGFYWGIAAVLMVVSRVPFHFYFKKLILITPLVLVFSFFIYLSYSQEHRIAVTMEALSGYYPLWDILALMAAKIYLSILVITLLGSYTHFNDFLWSLRRFRLPLIVTILSRVVYTYIFIFIDELHRIMRAYKSQTPVRRVSRLKVYSHIVAGIMLRSMDRSNYIYRAMLSRRFDCEFPEGNSNRLIWTDLAAVIVFLCIVVTMRILWDM
jgi:cobalt/nickel transport system permease protein